MNYLDTQFEISLGEQDAMRASDFAQKKVLNTVRNQLENYHTIIAKVSASFFQHMDQEKIDSIELDQLNIYFSELQETHAHQDIQIQSIQNERDLSCLQFQSVLQERPQLETVI
jgi:hypothetical protein